MKKIIMILLATASMSFSQDEKYSVYCSAGKGEMLVVDVTSEMDGHKIINCMAVFETPTKYRLVSPEINKMDILKGNIVSFEVHRIGRGMR